MTELRPKLAELFAYMDSTRAALIATARGMSASFAEMRPREGAWSPVEVLTHLAIVENGVAELVNKFVAKARAEGLGPDHSEESFMRSLDKFGVARQWKNFPLRIECTRKTRRASKSHSLRLRDRASVSIDADRRLGHGPPFAEGSSSATRRARCLSVVALRRTARGKTPEADRAHSRRGHRACRGVCTDRLRGRYMVGRK